jgi:hypothetical protein
MANNYIEVDLSTNERLAYKLREAVDGMEKSINLLSDLKDSMEQMTDGVTFTTIETQFGLATGKGQSVYNLLTGTVGELAADTNLAQLRSWLAAVAT